MKDSFHQSGGEDYYEGISPTEYEDNLRKKVELLELEIYNLKKEIKLIKKKLGEEGEYVFDGALGQYVWQKLED